MTPFPHIAEPLSAADPSSPHAETFPVSGRPPQPTPWEHALLLELGEVLRSARLTAGISLLELEPLVGSASSLSQIETGRMRTRASRLRPWLVRLRVDPDPVLSRFAAVIAPERPDGRSMFRPVASRPSRKPPQPPPLAPHERAALGAELWRAREAASLSRAALAAAIDCSRITIWFCERGLRRPTAELLDRWLEATSQTWLRRLLAFRFPGLIATRPRQFGRRGAPSSIRGRTDARSASHERSR